jgi:integrase
MNPTATMVSLAEDYLAARRQMGFSLKPSGGQLLGFARFADKRGHRGPVTFDLVVQWVQSASLHTPLTWARRLEVLRPFLKYRSQFDAGTAIVPRGYFGSAHRRLVPHIYSEQEIVALIKATDNLQPVDGLRPRTYRTLFGLLAATGCGFQKRSISRLRMWIGSTAYSLCARPSSANLAWYRSTLRHSWS